MKYLIIAGSSACVYLFILAAIRLFGEKELAQLSIIDLVFILLISNAVQNAMVGADNTLLGGLCAAGALFVVNFYSSGYSTGFQSSPLWYRAVPSCWSIRVRLTNKT